MSRGGVVDRGNAGFEEDREDEPMSNGEESPSDKLAGVFQYAGPDTPRTNAILVEGHTQEDVFRLLSHARQLERELVEYTARAERAEIAQVEASIRELGNVGADDRWEDRRDLSGGETDCAPSAKPTPEGRGSPPAGALESGSPYDAARDATPGGAAPGGVASSSAARTTEEERVVEEAMRWYEASPKQGCGDGLIGRYPREDGLLTACRALSKKRREA
jgi:hypothetical protein